MPKAKQIWEVSESNPWPDNYIAIFATDKYCQKLNQEFSHHTNIQQAINRARLLKIQYGVKQIRIFYPNRVSIIIKLKNSEMIDTGMIRFGNV